jgi:hypothetical protein
MLGDADYYVTIVRRPDPPGNVRAVRTPAGVKVSWDPPQRRSELRGCHVYRSDKSGLGYKRITAEPVVAAEFTDSAAGGGPSWYAVTAEEHSGLMSRFSKEVSVDAGAAPVILHYEAEAGHRRPPMRDVVDGSASGYRAVRLTKVRASEDAGSVTLAPDVARAGEYALWARVRHCGPGRGGRFAVGVGGRDVARVAVSSADWTWVKASADVALAPGAKLTLRSSTKGVAVDKIIVSDAPGYRPETADDRKAAPPRVTGLRAAVVTPNSVTLAWDPCADTDLYCYHVHVGERRDFAPSNRTLLCSPRGPAALDWGIAPARARWYKVIAVDKHGGESAPAAIRVETKPLAAVTRRLPAPAAAGGEGLTRGAGFVTYPGAAAGEQSLTFRFDLPTGGAWHAWLKYTPTFDRRPRYDSIGVSVDGGKGVRFATRPRPPRGQGEKPGRWFHERLPIPATLKGGAHEIKLIFANRDGIRTGMGQRVAALWVTNDASFAPPGYVPQVMFRDPAPWPGR